MHRFKFIIFTLFFLSSCGKNNGVEGEFSVLGASLSESKTISSDELTIALRICYAFRSKRMLYQSEFINQKFDYDLQTADCEGKEENNYLSTYLREEEDRELVFESDYSSEFFELMQTDTSGELSSLCAGIMRGENPESTIEVDEFERRQISFSKNEYDQFEVRYAFKEGEQYKVRRIDTFEIITSVHSDFEQNTKGRVIKASRKDICIGSEHEQGLVQTAKIP